MAPVPRDGETIGEVMMRGNVVMKGYLKNKTSTDAAFAGGWFHTGDLGVMHPDGYIQLKDRSKDIIISGGENISSIEVEDALYKHPAVQAAAVVAKPDDKWGETPCAFVELKPGAKATRRGDHRAAARRTSRATKCRATSCSAKCRRRARARSRSSSCGRWRRGRRRPRHLPIILRHLPREHILSVEEPAMARAARKLKSVPKLAGFAEEAEPFLHEEIVRGVPARRVQELIDRGCCGQPRLSIVSCRSARSSGGSPIGSSEGAPRATRSRACCA